MDEPPSIGMGRVGQAQRAAVLKRLVDLAGPKIQSGLYRLEAEQARTNAAVVVMPCSEEYPPATVHFYPVAVA